MGGSEPKGASERRPRISGYSEVELGPLNEREYRRLARCAGRTHCPYVCIWDGGCEFRWTIRHQCLSTEKTRGSGIPSNCDSSASTRTAHSLMFVDLIRVRSSRKHKPFSQGGIDAVAHSSEGDRSRSASSRGLRGG